MSLYSTNEIQTLLEAAAYKAGVELNTHGFQKLSEAIIREGDPYGVRMTPRYLKESIWQKAQNALSNNSIEIGLSEDRVDTLSLYLGFPHYRAYRNHYLEWKEVVNPKVVAKRSNKPTDLQVVLHEEDAITFGDQFKRSLDYSGLKYNWLNPDQEKATEQLEEAVYSIWLLSNKWSSNQILQMLKDDQLLSKKAKNILFFKLCELSPEVENTIPFNTEKLKLVSDPQLGIILSVFKSTLKPFGEDTDRRNNKNKNSIHTEIKKFKKFKGIFLDGKANIHAKYMAGGDMYIKIKK